MKKTPKAPESVAKRLKAHLSSSGTMNDGKTGDLYREAKRIPEGEETSLEDVERWAQEVANTPKRKVIISFAAEVQTAGDGDAWTGNALRFATKPEAEEYAKDLFSRWTAVKAFRVVESTDPVNR